MRPNQKRQIVAELVSNIYSRYNPLTKIKRCVMVVGDGGNDVPMMRAADISVDMSGPATDDTKDREGRTVTEIIGGIRETMLVADFSVRDWRALLHLITVHGVWNNDRIATVIWFSIYKNIVFHCIPLWMAFFTNASRIAIFDKVELVFYNITFTSLIPFAIGIFRKKYSENDLLTKPGIYRQPGNSSTQSFSGILKWILGGLIHSCMIFFWVFCTLEHGTDLPIGRVLFIILNF